jgi:hypothetical protein
LFNQQYENLFYECRFLSQPYDPAKLKNIAEALIL